MNDKTIKKINDAIKILSKNGGKIRNAPGINFANDLIDIISQQTKIKIGFKNDIHEISSFKIIVSKTKINFDNKFHLTLGLILLKNSKSKKTYQVEFNNKINDIILE